MASCTMCKNRGQNIERMMILDLISNLEAIKVRSLSDTSTKLSSEEVTPEPQHLSTSSEFTVVDQKSDRRKSRKNRQELVKSVEENFHRKVKFNAFTRWLNRIVDVTVPKVSQAKYTRDVTKILKKECLTVLKSNSISEIICYGLGQFLDKKSAEYQLGFLLCLRKQFNCIPVYVYDPLFCDEEIRILRRLGLQVIENNEEGKRVVQNKTTLVFMPRCSYELTNNFLFANWGIGLNNCILLANSFENVKNDFMIPPLCKYQVEVHYLLGIAPYVTEIRLKNSFEYSSAFNTLSIHIFSKENLLKVPPGFWENTKEPQYSYIHNDFIRASVCKKHLPTSSEFTRKSLEVPTDYFENRDEPQYSHRHNNFIRESVYKEHLLTSSEFTVVTRKSGSRHKSGKNIQELIKSTDKNSLQFNHNLFTRSLNKILDVIPKVRQATYTKDVIQVLEKECLTVLKSNSISEIICYGLGQFSNIKSAEYQLGFLLCLREHFNHIPVYVYDPLFCHEEIRILRHLGLQIIEKNEEGKRVVQNTTLVYMPHCSYKLTNNFLYANWGNGLNNCILLANSFEEVQESFMIPPLRKYQVEVRYLLGIALYVTEIKLENSFEYSSAFNTLSIHIFSKENLLKVPTNFWENKEEPQYSHIQNDFIEASNTIKNEQ